MDDQGLSNEHLCGCRMQFRCRGRHGPQPGFVHLGESKGDSQWHLYRVEGYQPAPTLQPRPPAPAIAFAAGISAAPAETSSLEDLVSAVVRIKTTINPDGRTVDALGRATYRLATVSNQLITKSVARSAFTGDVYQLMLSLRYSFN